MSICTLCKAILPAGSTETWKTEDGEAIEVARGLLVSAIIDTSLGEFEICEPCYSRKLPSFFTPQDIAEIHYQFGLEYRDRAKFTQSIESLRRALCILETADILAALAFAEDKAGHQQLAIGYYRRALQIEPLHFMAQQNLRLIDDSGS
jgi:tetratricopeptide (TPR) repeat protein